MRESIGGTWLLGFIITFVVLFASFLAYAISYTKAFNMKSEILNFIERGEGYTDSTNSDLENMSDAALKEDLSVEAQAFSLIKKSGYNYKAASNVDCSRYGHTGEKALKVGGYCVTKYCPGMETVIDPNTGNSMPVAGTDSKTYYKVTTFIAMKLPILEVTMSIPVTGETRTLFFDQSNGMECVKYAD